MTAKIDVLMAQLRITFEVDLASGPLRSVEKGAYAP